MTRLVPATTRLAPTTRRIAPQAGPQTVFCASPADIAIYGGSAGGGKSWALAYEAGRYASVPGYAAVIFRRTRPELEGGGSVWQESKRIYPHLGGYSRTHPQLEWNFKSGATIEFRSAQHEHTVEQYQSKQWDYLGIDELTHFTSYQFWYLISRVRSGQTKVPRRIRASCNPDPDSFVAELIDWWIGPDGTVLAERSGRIRWFVRLDQKLIWGDSPDAVWAHDPRRIRRRGEAPRDEFDLRPEPLSFTFIRASARDNRILMQNDPSYLSRLALIPGAMQKRLLEGNWRARDKSGDYFDRTWCRIVDSIDERNVLRRVRWWDKAATTPSDANPDPDWTRGFRLAQLDTGHYVVEDLQSRRAGPAEIDALQLSTAEMDGVACEIGQWQDPGQAGLVDTEHTRMLLLGYPFEAIAARENKRTYAAAWTGLAKTGRLWWLRREYLPEVFAELEGFPLRTHDDCMDSLSGCFQRLIGPGFTVDYEASDDPRHPAPLPSDDDDARWERDEDDEDDGDYGSGRGRGAYV